MAEYRLFVRQANPDPEPPPPPPAGFVPLFGTSAPNTAGFRERQAKYSPAVSRFFLQDLRWTDGRIVDLRATTTNQAMYVSFKVWDEANVRTQIAGAPTERDIFLTYHHEPEGGGESAGADMPPATFRARQARLRELWVDAGSPANVKLISTLMGFTYRTPTRNPEDWYVDTTTYGGQVYKVFDGLFCDQYDPGYKNNRYADFSSLNVDLVAFGKAKKLPIGFGELGSAIGPQRTTNLTLRRAQILDSAQWCKDNAGTGPGQVWVACYWDVVANASWKPADANYSIYGGIPKQQYTLDLEPVLIAEPPGSRAGQVAYGAPNGDPTTRDAWRDLCIESRTYHGIS